MGRLAFPPCEQRPVFPNITMLERRRPQQDLLLRYAMTVALLEGCMQRLTQCQIGHESLGLYSNSG